MFYCSEEPEYDATFIYNDELYLNFCTTKIFIRIEFYLGPLKVFTLAEVQQPSLDLPQAMACLVVQLQLLLEPLGCNNSFQQIHF